MRRHDEARSRIRLAISKQLDWGHKIQTLIMI